MTYKNPREVVKKEDGFLSYYFASQVANLLARLACKTKFITPNIYTTLSLISAGITAWLFANNQLKPAVITLLLTLIFDCADGQTARLKGLKSQFGHWYDYHTDKIKDIALLLCLAWGAYSLTGEIYVFTFAFLGIAFQFLRNITRFNRVVFELEQEHKKSEPTIINENKNQFLTVLKHSTLFKEADRYLLFIIFALLNKIAIMIIIYAGLEFFYASMSAYLNYKKFAKFDKTNE